MGAAGWRFIETGDFANHFAESCYRIHGCSEWFDRHNTSRLDTPGIESPAIRIFCPSPGSRSVQSGYSVIGLIGVAVSIERSPRGDGRVHLRTFDLSG